MWRVRITDVAMEAQKMSSVCIVDLDVTVNNIKIMNVAQQRFYGEFMSLAAIKRT